MTQEKLEIRLERFIQAPPMDVWRHLVDPEKFFVTFTGVGFSGELKTGELVESNSAGEVAKALVVEATPGKRLALRWNYDPEKAKTFVIEESTLCEFLLIEENGGTRLKFSETEFENLPEAIREQSFHNVNSGWPSIIEDFGSMVPRGDDAWLVAQWYGAVPGTVEEVWYALVNFKMFPVLNGFSGKVDEGQTVHLDFGEYGSGPILIEKVAPQSELAFRSYPGTGHQFEVDPEKSTLTKFMVIDCGMAEGIWVILRESEFDRIPAEGRRKVFEGQQDGWNQCGAHLMAQFEKKENEAK